MGKDKRSLQRSRAKKKARREKKKSERGRGHAVHDTVFEGFSKVAIGKAPIRDALVSRSLSEDGMGPVILSRVLNTGEVAMGVFLLDKLCMGVKNAFYTLRGANEYDQDVERIGGQDGFDAVSPEHARKLVEGAVAYARELGFEPHSDYRKAKVVFGDIDPEECVERFVYGKNGKPFYVSGPYDSPRKVERIMATLRGHSGDGGFEYIVEEDILEDE